MSTTTLGSLVHAILCNVSTGPFLTGWLMLALLVVMALFAAEKRRRAHFERFQFTHLLFLPFFALWQLHGVRTCITPSNGPSIADRAGPPCLLSRYYDRYPGQMFCMIRCAVPACCDHENTPDDECPPLFLRRPDSAPYCSWKQVGVFWF